MHNIDKSAFKRGEYVGYADGTWRIFKWGSGWRATHDKHGHLRARTLKEMSALLSNIKAETQESTMRVSVKGGKFAVARIMADAGIPFVFVREENPQNPRTIGDLSERFSDVFSELASSRPLDVRYITKTNPAKKSKRAGKAYINRPSQITKRAPSKRLRKRRDMMDVIHESGISGVFPNPAPTSFREIHVQQMGGKDEWRTVARFPATKEGERNARNYASVHARYSKVPVRVVK